MFDRTSNMSNTTSVIRTSNVTDSDLQTTIDTLFQTHPDIVSISVQCLDGSQYERKRYLQDSQPRWDINLRPEQQAFHQLLMAISAGVLTGHVHDHDHPDDPDDPDGPDGDQPLQPFIRESLTVVTPRGAQCDDQCIICMEKFGQQEIIVLPCVHSFHKTCMDPWLDEKSTCPVCRNDMNIDV